MLLRCVHAVHLAEDMERSEERIKLISALRWMLYFLNKRHEGTASTGNVF